MKAAIFSLIILFLSTSVLMGQKKQELSKNPFKDAGYDVLMATSSKGEFVEFHDQTDIVEIGSVLYDTKTKQIIKILDKNDSIDIISSATPALSIDPLCEKYYWISPYAYCANNPINAIDPDGRKIVIITKSGGKTVNYEMTSSGNYRNMSTGKTYSSSSFTGHVGKIVDGYSKMLNSGDKNYVNQISTLINSDNTHHIDATKIKASNVTAGSRHESTSESIAKAAKGEGVGTYTVYSFKDDKLSSGLEKSSGTTIAHEVQHQYDYDTGNMKDSIDKNGNLIKGNDSPAEQRAMKNEDKVRDDEKLKRRTEY